MWGTNAHLSDEELVRFADGEASAWRQPAIRRHLARCWTCRLRLRELENAVAAVTILHREGTHPPLPAPDGPRALLRARLAAAGHTKPLPVRTVAGTGATAAALIGIFWLIAARPERAAVPRADLTPGAVRQIAASDVCRADLSDNADVVPAVRRQVFAEYGMPDGERPGYEVDYLITPALGGSDDIRNLWPQPYSSQWNAYVKDALEDRLRRMVCAGLIDLPTAQAEIARNWVAAYKKYFHTSRPLPAHMRFRRDEE